MSESEKKKREEILLSKLEYEENKRDMKELIMLTKNFTRKYRVSRKVTEIGG